MSFDESDRAENAAASTLFFAEADEHEGLELKVGYLEFLWMQPGAAAEADKLRTLMSDYPREEVERAICLVLDAGGWRPHLVACVALLCGHTTPKTLWYLWRAIQADSWVAPQLVATASLVDPEFANKAEWALLSTRLQPKAAGALGAMLAERLGPEDELPEDLEQAVQRGSAHPDDAAGIAQTWKQSVLRAFNGADGPAQVSGLDCARRLPASH